MKRIKEMLGSPVFYLILPVLFYLAVWRSGVSSWRTFGMRWYRDYGIISMIWAAWFVFVPIALPYIEKGASRLFSKDRIIWGVSSMIALVMMVVYIILPSSRMMIIPKLSMLGVLTLVLSCVDFDLWKSKFR